jgi:hypothetical protein
VKKVKGSRAQGYMAMDLLGAASGEVYGQLLDCFGEAT